MRYEISDVLQLLQLKKGKRTVVFAGKRGVDVGSSRIRTYLEKGTDCVCCGAKGTHFMLEYTCTHGWHFNLYAVNRFGKEVLMTRDHIKAKSRGGTDRVSNSQPLCRYCNSVKAARDITLDELTADVEGRLKHGSYQKPKDKEDKDAKYDKLFVTKSVIDALMFTNGPTLVLPTYILWLRRNPESEPEIIGGDNDLDRLAHKAKFDVNKIKIINVAINS